MSDQKNETSFLGGATGGAGKSSFFSAFSGQIHKTDAPSSGVPADTGPDKARIDELERKLKRLEEERATEKAEASKAAAADGKKGPDVLELLKVRMMALENELHEVRERERVLLEGQEKAARSGRDSAEGIRAVEAKVAALEASGHDFRHLSSRLDHVQNNVVGALAGKVAAFEELGGKLAAALQVTEKKVAESGEFGKKFEEAIQPLSLRLDSVEKDILRPLAVKLEETRLKVASLVSEFPKFLVYENRLTKVELKTDETRSTVADYGTAQASLEERISSIEIKSEGTETELRAAWDMVHMLSSRVDGWDRKLGEVFSSLTSFREEVHRREKDLAAAEEQFRDIASKTNNMWGRFTFVEKEFSDIRARFMALDAGQRENEKTKARLASVETEIVGIQERIVEKRETIAQMKSQIHSMNSLLGKFGA